MNKRTRLIFLLLALGVLLTIGRIITGSFDFALTQFWFNSGLFLLILLSLIDQPAFSKDANIFANAVTGWISLLLIPSLERNLTWNIFFGITTYLIISSYVLIWIRKNELKNEHYLIAFISRINREIGKPEVLFSTFFIWGAVRQFGINSSSFDALLVYWMIFTILNMPAFASILNNLFERKSLKEKDTTGIILKMTDPRVIEVRLSADFPENLIGKKINIFSGDKEKIGEAVFIDERVMTGSRIGKTVLTSKMEKWKKISDRSLGQCYVELIEEVGGEEGPISVVDKGTTIDNLIFYLCPKIKLEEGEIVYIQNELDEKVFYQIISAIITEELTDDGNLFQSVKVTSSQLGLWNDTGKKFSPYTWVPPSGQLIFRGKEVVIDTSTISKDFSIVGNVPNSNFPVHVCLEDIVTHNTAIIGVTGSGKSYLAFHIIEALIEKGIKVMILDLTREHYQYLHKHSPFQLNQSADVRTWLTTAGSPALAIHQFATSSSFPATTAEFTKVAFEEIKLQSRLVAGKNLPARLCIIFEEAHSLIPEWNQVSIQSDKDHVNNTAKIILQGRKFGLGGILITQRTANVTKTILNQCNTIFALQSFDQTGLEFLRNYMGDEYSHALSRLPQRQSVLVGKSSSSQKPIIFQTNNNEARWTDPEPETPEAPTQS